MFMSPTAYLCFLRRFPELNINEYGFTLQSELGSTCQFISSVEKGSLAEKANLQVDQIIVEVNEVNVLHLNHYDVVKLVGQYPNEVSLLVMDSEVLKEYLENNRPLPKSSDGEPTVKTFNSSDALNNEKEDQDVEENGVKETDNASRSAEQQEDSNNYSYYGSVHIDNPTYSTTTYDQLTTPLTINSSAHSNSSSLRDSDYASLSSPTNHAVSNSDVTKSPTVHNPYVTISPVTTASPRTDVPDFTKPILSSSGNKRKEFKMKSNSSFAEKAQLFKNL